MRLDEIAAPWPMLYHGPDADEFTDEHEGYVAGRTADGRLSDIWTDVTEQPRATFSVYQARCDCGWVGATYPTTMTGYLACANSWADNHLRPYLAARRAMATTGA